MNTNMLLALALTLATTSQAQSLAPDGGLNQTPRRVLQPSCSEYIQLGTWKYRYSDDYPFNEWILSLVPTACGRNIDSSETAYMFYEIVKKFGQNEHWRNNRGMINQLTCHLYIARSKEEWNLEPWRPYVGFNATVTAECNPVTPDPDPTYH